MTHPKRRTLVAALLAVLLAVVPTGALALTLDQARSQGLVGEQADGYLGAVGSPSGEVKALVDEINQARRKKYKKIAEKNGTSVDAVAALAGAKLVDRAGRGEYVRGTSGGWKQK
jgi:uncharacterized protein YdbL (DUF1318 family)